MLNNFDQCEMSLMDEDHISHDQSFVVEMAGYSSSKGGATAIERLSVECQRELASKFEMEDFVLLDWD